TPSIDEGSSLRKPSKRATPEKLADASGSTTRIPAGKGKELVELEEAPKWGIPSKSYVRRTSSDIEVVDHLWLEPSVDRGSVVWGVSARGPAPRPGKTRILALRATNKELKLGASQDLVATTELCAKGLEEDVNKLSVELESLNN
ncbi:hypothetical protein BHE74_00056890, partial [Ensete ventricosum]